MKPFLHIFMLSLLACSVAAQDNHTIQLLLAQTTVGKNIPATSRQRIDRQLLSVLGGAGLNNQFSVFVVQPAVDILEEGKIEGIKTQQTVKINLQLKLTNALSGEVLDVQDVRASGAGATLDEALNRSFQSIRRDNPALSKSITGFRQKISEYYAAQCGAVTAAAAEFAAQKKYREAFATLHAIPQGLPCYQEVAGKKLEYFNMLQQANCQNNLARANAAAAGNNFRSALAILSEIDASAPCFSEAKTAVEGMASKVDADLQQQYEWMFSFYKEGKAAETARWNAMTAMGLSCMRGNGKYLLVE